MRPGAVATPNPALCEQASLVDTVDSKPREPVSERKELHLILSGTTRAEMM